jgi:CVNH domain-containing protein
MSTKALGTKFTLIAGTASLLSLAAAPAHAQGIPGGSYARTCTNIQTYGGQLTAECQRMDGGWDRSSVDLGRCAGGVANTDGRLTCGGSYGGGYGEGWHRHNYEGSSGYQPYGRYYNGYGR